MSRRTASETGDGTFSTDLLIRFVPYRDTLTLTVGGPRSEGGDRGVATLSPFHRTEARPAYTLLVENRSDRACVVELSVEEPFGLADAAPRFADDWAEWRLPPPTAPGETAETATDGVDTLSADCRILHLLLLPDQPRQIALEILPACRRAPAAEYLFAVGGQESVTQGTAVRLQPAVGSLRLIHGEGSLMALLPEVYQEAARAERQRTVEDMPSFGERFLLGFGEMADRLDNDIGLLPELFGVDTAPQEWLRWLATWVGLTLDDRWPEMRRRELIRNAITLYRRRGTVGGLADYLELFTGVRPQISDTPVEGMRLGPGARLGSPGAWLGNIAPHTFVVTLSPGRPALSERSSDSNAAPLGEDELVWDAVTLATLHDIISANKPAHTAYELRVLLDGATPVVVRSVPDPSLSENPAP